jgi:hypothetical protein
MSLLELLMGVRNASKPEATGFIYVSVSRAVTLDAVTPLQTAMRQNIITRLDTRLFSRLNLVKTGDGVMQIRLKCKIIGRNSRATLYVSNRYCIPNFTI